MTNLCNVINWIKTNHKLLRCINACACCGKMSPPKHAVKLPYWSSPWYCQYRCDLAHHMYVSYVSSLISHLPLLATPRLGSEAEPDVLYFLLLPRGPIHCP